MEESGEVSQKENAGNVCTAENDEGQTSEATGEVDVCKPCEGAEARRSRLKLFNKVMEKSLAKFIDDANVSFQSFAKTFQPLSKKKPQVMESIHKQFIEDLQRIIQEDINRLIEEGQLQCKLDELDKLQLAAKDNLEPSWRPSGVPEQDLSSFVMPYYQKQEAYLRRELKKIQAENAALAQRVQAGREGVAQTEQRIAAAVDEWKASVREYQRLASSLCPADTFDV
ncbi:polyamine-modulated factor 1 [Myripristis murdjan]|uniref:Si:dkey-6i22.5 n=1 Tax=Myripristis murdjan TaxID=586833 RepID=A0A667XVQ7_9TELE|nr:polyamine-modulated factor 1-like [Myripristis murdjan]